FFLLRRCIAFLIASSDCWKVLRTSCNVKEYLPFDRKVLMKFSRYAYSVVILSFCLQWGTQIVPFCRCKLSKCFWKILELHFDWFTLLLKRLRQFLMLQIYEER